LVWVGCVLPDLFRGWVRVRVRVRTQRRRLEYELVLVFS